MNKEFTIEKLDRELEQQTIATHAAWSHIIELKDANNALKEELEIQISISSACMLRIHTLSERVAELEAEISFEGDGSLFN